MIKLITASERHEAKVGDWLSSYYLFSFADYHDPANMQFGPLRVFNDDTIAPHAGFPQHPHAEMEIVTIVLDGELTHTDSLGNNTKLRAGDVQRITAGTGITHGETNETDGKVHACQLWFLPKERGLAPSYEFMSLGFNDTKDKLVPLVTGQKVLEDVVYMNSNSTVYYAALGIGEDIDFRTFKTRKVLVYVLDGNLIINGVEADKYDQVRMEDQDIVSIHASSAGSILLIDVPAMEANY